MCFAYSRFCKTGRACAGEYHYVAPGTFYLDTEGEWIKFYLLSHPFVFAVQKIFCVIILNRWEAEFEQNKK